jgi:uncharacterized protein (DUF1800 family)
MVNAPDAFGPLIALNRFGLGARPGDLAAAAGDPRGFLKAEVGSADVAVVTADLPPTSAALQQLFADQERIRQERERGTQVLAGAQANGMMATGTGVTPMAEQARAGCTSAFRQDLRARRSGATRGGANRSRASSGDCNSGGDEARAPFHRR